MTEGIHVVLVVNDEAAHWQGYRDRLAVNDGAASVSVAVPDGERRDSILSVLGDKVRTVAEDPAKLLAAESPQLAVVTVPPLDSPPIIDAALDAGAHVLTEKPAAVSDTVLEPLARKALACDRHLMLAFAGGQQPAVRDAARIVRDEAAWAPSTASPPTTSPTRPASATSSSSSAAPAPPTPGSSRSVSAAAATSPGSASTSSTCFTSSPGTTSSKSPL